jgi:hypothetical protein
MKNKIEETTKLLLEGKLTKDEADKILLSLSNVMPSLPSEIEIQNYAFAWRKRNNYIGNYGLEKKDGIIMGAKWVVNEMRLRLGNGA